MFNYYLTHEDNKYMLENQNTIIDRYIKGVKRVFDLPPGKHSQKSFYGKAKVIETEKGRYLLSYNTIICFISYGGTFTKLWDGYSATTMKHINSFVDFIKWVGGGKKWWESLTCDESYTYDETKTIYENR